MAYSGIPAAISSALLSVSTNKYVIFILMNVILMIIGMFMDITPAILIFTPIFLPIAQSFGMSDIQFGVMLIYNQYQEVWNKLRSYFLNRYMSDTTSDKKYGAYRRCDISKAHIEN